jgi:cytochrome c oxidase subunit 1
MVSGGFIITFTPQFLLGNHGMPRRYATYPPDMQWLHVISTIGAFLLGFGLVATLVYLAAAWWNGKPAGDNPWRSASFEWRSPSPPPHENFPEPPKWTTGPYAYPQDEA